MLTRLFRNVRKTYWGLQHRFNPKHRYNIIHTGLKPGYWDPRDRILHGVMSMVREFVEDTADIINWESEPEHAEAWEALTKAVDWWKYFHEESDKIDKEWVSDHYTPELGNQLYERECALEEEANKHLAQIMKYRNFIWYP